MATGCYIDKYLPASYKGVPFSAMDVQSEHGRRGHSGEFPFGEDVAYADLGRKARKYSISGRFVENNHILAAAALIAVCETPGPGLLMHPTRGLIQVACTSLRVRDNPLENQGVTEIDMEFIEAPATLVGLNFGNTLFAITMTAINAAAFGEFREQYKPNVVRFYRSAEVLKTSSEAIGVLQQEFNLATNEQRNTQIYEALADFDRLRNDPGVLRDPARMEQSLQLGLSAVDRFTTGMVKYNSFKRIANWAAQGSSLEGEAFTVEDSVYTTIRVLSAGYMARGLSEEDPTTINDALKEMDSVLAILEEELALSKQQCNNCLTVALIDFHTQVQKVLLKRVYDLPPVFSYDFSGGVHPLAAAYEIYGDAKRVRSVERRNSLQSPIFMGPTVLGTGV